MDAEIRREAAADAAHTVAEWFPRLARHEVEQITKISIAAYWRALGCPEEAPNNTGSCDDE
jgi:hypothetical protein